MQKCTKYQGLTWCLYTCNKSYRFLFALEISNSTCTSIDLCLNGSRSHSSSSASKVWLDAGRECGELGPNPSETLMSQLCLCGAGDHWSGLAWPAWSWVKLSRCQVSGCSLPDCLCLSTGRGCYTCGEIMAKAHSKSLCKQTTCCFCCFMLSNNKGCILFFAFWELVSH